MAKLFPSLLLAGCSALIFALAGRSDPPSPKEQKATEKIPARTDLYGDPLPPGAIARLGTMRLRHESILGTAFLDGGKILATGGYWSLRFWDTATGRLVAEIKGNFNSPLIPSADGKWLATVEDKSITIREVPSGRLVRRWEGSGLEPDLGEPLAFSPDGKVLVEGGLALRLIRLWDTSTGKEIRRLQAPKDGSTVARFTNEGSRLVTGGRENNKDITCHWDWITGKLLKKSEVGIWPRRAARLSHDGRWLAVAPYPSQAVRILDTETGNERCRLQGKNSAARYGLAFSPDDRLLATNWWEEGDNNATISLWNAETGQLARRFSIPVRIADRIEFAPDGRTLLTTNTWTAIRLWDLNTGKPLFERPAHESPIFNLQYLPDGKSLISTCYDTTRVWDAVTGRHRRQLPFCGWRSHLLPGGRTILCDAPAGAITVRDLESGKVLRRFPLEEKLEPARGGDETRQLSCIAEFFALTPDGRTLTAYRKKDDLIEPGVFQYDFNTGRLLSYRPETSGFVPSIFSPDGRLAAGTVILPEIMVKKNGSPRHEAAQPIGLIHVLTGRQFLTLPHRDQPSTVVAFSPDSQSLVTVTHEQFWEGNELRTSKYTLHLWELRSAQERLSISARKNGWTFSAISFSSDGRTLAASRRKVDTREQLQTIQLFDLVTSRELLRRSGFDAVVDCLAISPDGKTLASGHNDTTILVWDIAEASRSDAAKVAADLKELEAWWSDLAGADARKAHTAIWELVDHPKQAVPLLRDRLKPASAVPPEQLRQLLSDLDSKEFKTREGASKKLAQFAEDVEPALQEALKASKSAEQRRRIEALLAAPHIVPVGEKLRHLRAVEVLEHIGTPEAQQVLQGLAKGAADARLTQEAKASLERLNPRPIALP